MNDLYRFVFIPVLLSILLITFIGMGMYFTAQDRPQISSCTPELDYQVCIVR